MTGRFGAFGQSRVNDRSWPISTAPNIPIKGFTGMSWLYPQRSANGGYVPEADFDGLRNERLNALNLTTARPRWAVHCRLRCFARDLRVTSGVNQSPI